MTALRRKHSREKKPIRLLEPLNLKGMADTLSNPLKRIDLNTISDSDQFNDATEEDQPLTESLAASHLSSQDSFHPQLLDDYSDSDYHDDEDEDDQDYQYAEQDDPSGQEERDELKQMGRVEDADWELARGGEYKKQTAACSYCDTIIVR